MIERLLWADGYLRIKNHVNTISIEFLSDDALELRYLFEKSGVWNFYYRKRDGRRNQTTIHTTNRIFCKFLKSQDFLIKSTASPDKILKFIPKQLKKYFFLGWFDGDGCFYFNERWGTKQFVLSGNFNQNWKAVDSLFQNIGIKFSIKKITNKNGNSSSKVVVCGRKNILKIKNYIYSEYDENKIGLKRKYNKCCQCV